MGTTISDRFTTSTAYRSLEFWPQAPLTVSPHTPVSALSRTSQHLDCYVCGKDGSAYTNWSNANERNSQWYSWFRIGDQTELFPQQTLFTPVARRATEVSLFAVGTNGGLYCTWWDLGANNAHWNPWFRIGQQSDVFPPQSSVTAIARSPERLDIFVVGYDGGLYSNWCEQGIDFGQWHSWFRIGQQGDVFPTLTHAAAVACTPNRLDIFAVGNDGGLYSTWWDRSVNNARWNSWFRIGGLDRVFPEQSTVAAVVRKNQHIDLLLTGYDGGIYSTSWDGNQDPINWNNWQRVGGLKDSFPHHAKVSALSRTEDRLDVFAIGHDGMVYSNWWHQFSNNGHWGEWYRIGHEGENFPQHGQVAALARHPEHIDLFTTGHNGGIYTTNWDLYSNEGRWQSWNRL